MKASKLQEILNRLSNELQDSDDVDARAKIRELQQQVERLDAAQDSEVDSLWDHAKELESRFAAHHPTLGRIARELADAIAKMGI